MIFTILLFASTAFSSSNKDYYVCDTNIDSPYCTFVFNDGAKANPDNPVPTSWGSIPVEHDVENHRNTDFGLRKLVSIDGTQLTVSPKPWTNGVS